MKWLRIWSNDRLLWL